MKIRFKGGPGSGHHGHRGIPGHRGGSLPETGSSNMLPPEQRVWQGESYPGGRKINNDQTGKIGEHLAAKALEDRLGVPFSTLNEGVNNAPIDLGGDHHAIEVKAGPASNSSRAQQWRATISTAGKAERAMLKKMSRAEKRAYNAHKKEQVLERKYEMLDEMSRIAGAEIKPATVGIILTPDGKRGDVFFIPGFHTRIGWNKGAVEENYIGTYETDADFLKELGL